MAIKGDVFLGDEAKDDITGLSGVVIAITDWLNGCQRIAIQPREIKDGKPVDPYTVDVEQVTVTTKSAKPQAKAPSGGPQTMPERHQKVKP